MKDIGTEVIVGAMNALSMKEIPFDRLPHDDASLGGGKIFIHFYVLTLYATPDYGGSFLDNHLRQKF